MATRRSRSSLRDDNRMVVASRRRGGHGRDGRRFAATKRSRSSLRDDDIDNEVVMSWRSPLRGDETVAVVASRRDDGMMAVASRRRGGHGGDGRRFAATRWSQLYFLPCFHTSTVWTNELTPMSLFSVTKTEMVQDGEFMRHVNVTVFRNKTEMVYFLIVNARLRRAHDQNGRFGQNGQNDPNGLIFENWRFLGRFKPFLLH